MNVGTLHWLWSDHGHRCRGPCDQRFNAMLILAEHVGFAEVDRPAGFHHATDGSQTTSQPLGEIRDLDLGGDRVLVRGNEREAGKTGGHIGDGGGDAAVDEADLLLVDNVEIDDGLDIAGLYHRQPATDVLHELLSLQMSQDGLTEGRVFRD